MAHKPTIEAYDKIAEEFHSRNSVTLYAEEYLVFKNLLKNGNKILEIGCGTGRDAEGLINLGLDYTGVDASEGMLNLAKARVKNGNFQNGDFYKLDFDDEYFDGFWAAASFLHVPKSEMDIPLQEAKRILKPNGIGFISLKLKTTTDEGLIKEDKLGGIERYFSFYEQDEFKNILERNGFEVIEIMIEEESDKLNTKWLCYFVKKT